MRPFISLLILLFSLSASAQSVAELHTNLKASFRGLSVVNDSVVWVSGSKGTVGRSIDGGISFSWQTVAGFEKIDFRDIEAFDKNTAVIMGIASPAYILRTIDGGKNWTKVYENADTSMFLDAMHFSSSKNGIVVGDPINGKAFIATTKNGGKSWQEMSENKRPTLSKGEACFASSGTNVLHKGGSNFILVTGGKSSDLYYNNKKNSLPLVQGWESTGANSVAMNNKGQLMIVGGDFTQNDSIRANAVFLQKSNKMTLPVINPTGYRSCVEWLFGETWITCGLNGVDISMDNGSHWQNISKSGFHVVQKAKNGTSVFLAGNGKIGRLMR